MPRKRLSRSQEYVKNNLTQPIDLEAVRERQARRQEEIARKKEKLKAPPAISARKKAKTLRRRGVYALIILLIIAAVAVQVVNIISLNREKQDLKTSQQVLKKEKSKLQEELNNVNSSEYVEQQAREQLKLIKPGEILYVFPEITGSGINKDNSKSESDSDTN